LIGKTVNNAINSITGGTGQIRKKTGLFAAFIFVTVLVDCAFADPDVTMVTIAPESYHQYKGINTSKNEVSTKFEATKKLLLSNLFKAIQGFDAIVLMWSVLSEKSELIGSVSALFKPETLLNQRRSPEHRLAYSIDCRI
jgi:hypothetical protein